MMISGHVQAWVKDHCNGQKTDLNDAFAILNLAYDRWLTPIRGKTREECRLLALPSSYRQLKGQRTKTMVHVKATLHAWGFPIRTGSFGSVRISVSGEVIPGAAQRGCPLYLRCSMPDLMR